MLHGSWYWILELGIFSDINTLSKPSIYQISDTGISATLLQSNHPPPTRVLILTRGRRCVEGDLGAVGAVQGVATAPDSEGVEAVGLQLRDHGAVAVHPVCGPPKPAVLTVFLGGGLARCP